MRRGARPQHCRRRLCCGRKQRLPAWRSAAIVSAHRHLLDQAVTANPTFALSRQLGGADGDLIIGGCLVDIKTTINPSMRRQAAYQLVGYLLADTHDERGVTDVGFYLSRVPDLISWPAATLIAEMSEGRASLGQIRSAFAAKVARIGPRGVPGHLMALSTDDPPG
jgi:hypothetical protein